MQSKSLDGLEPWLRPYARYLVSLAGYAGARSVRITSVRRSRAAQAALYARYLQGRSRFPAAPPGRSLHEQGIAWDMVTEPYSALWTLGSWWQQMGGTWGGNSDPIHFDARGH